MLFWQRRIWRTLVLRQQVPRQIPLFQLIDTPPITQPIQLVHFVSVIFRQVLVLEIFPSRTSKRLYAMQCRPWPQSRNFVVSRFVPRFAVIWIRSIIYSVGTDFGLTQLTHKNGPLKVGVYETRKVPYSLRLDNHGLDVFLL